MDVMWERVYAMQHVSNGYNNSMKDGVRLAVIEDSEYVYVKMVRIEVSVAMTLLREFTNFNTNRDGFNATNNRGGNYRGAHIVSVLNIGSVASQHNLNIGSVAS
eukprot:GHVR01057784.1.p1 GENE.GHVR01057784.1~~GHVR01057784.1.p1  ORF type:complete len:104 (+),score=11.06 GHVR01057784.1:757-1068(+)